jgi:lipid-binding SYLF domain-containing protein
MEGAFDPMSDAMSGPFPTGCSPGGRTSANIISEHFSEGNNMNTIKAFASVMTAVALVASAGCTSMASTSTSSTGDAATGRGPISMETQREISAGYRSTLDRLYETTPGSRELVAKARGVLVFPKVYAAGFVVGGEYGEGELRVGNATDGYYRTTTASVGLQIGAQSRSLVFLFMTQDALDKFRAGKGWAGGVDASVAVLKLGANGAVDVNAAGAPTVAFVMTNAGLMANLNIEGTKVTRIE